MAADCSSPTISTPTDYSPSSTPTTSISASSVLDSSGSQEPDADDRFRRNSNPVLRKLITPLLELLTRVHNSIRLVFFLLFLLVQDTIAYRVSGSRSASSREHRRNSSTASNGASSSSSAAATAAAAETDAAGWHWIAGRRHRAKREIVGALTWTFGWLPIIVLGVALLLGLWMAEWVSGVAATVLAAGVKVLSKTG